MNSPRVRSALRGALCLRARGRPDKLRSMSKAVLKRSRAKATSKFVASKQKLGRGLGRSAQSRRRRRTSLYSTDEANWLNALVHSAARGCEQRRMKQWDIFLFPYPAPEDPHPAVVVSNNGICSNPDLQFVNALPCQSVRPYTRPK